MPHAIYGIGVGLDDPSLAQAQSKKAEGVLRIEIAPRVKFWCATDMQSLAPEHLCGSTSRCSFPHSSA